MRPADSARPARRRPPGGVGGGRDRLARPGRPGGRHRPRPPARRGDRDLGDGAVRVAARRQAPEIPRGAQAPQVTGPLRYGGAMHPGPGPLALVGSGEYLAVMAGVEGALIEGRPRRYLQIPTAAAPEGPDRLQYWLDLGAAQAERLGVQQVPVVVRDRDEAGSEDLAARIDGAGLVYLSGGNPQFLARTLRGTRVWAAIEAAWRSGAALAGCSAGAIALTDWVPAVRSPARAPEPGLGVLPWLRVLPHFDQMRSWAPDLAARAAAGAPPGTTVIGIDEDTAIVDLSGGGRNWQVHGRQQAWVLSGGQDHDAGHHDAGHHGVGQAY